MLTPGVKQHCPSRVLWQFLNWMIMNINARIKQARVAAGISQIRLATLLGVTRSAVSQWESEHGTVPRPEHLARLAELLHTDYEWLATGKKSREEKPVSVIREDTPSRYKSALSPEQEELLKLYGALSLKSRLALMEFLKTL